MKIKDKNIELAYEKVEEKIILSESYVNFIIKNIIDNKTFESKIREYFSDETGAFQSERFYEFIQDIKYMEMLSHALGIEDEFYVATINGAKDNNLIDTVINTKLLETKYGNPYKKDFTCNDVIFSILETIFGLDTLMESVSNKKVLIEKFKRVLAYSSEFNINSTKDCEDNYVQFYEELNNLYKNTFNMTDYEEIKEYVKDNCNGLKPFIQAGLSSHVRKVVWGEKDSYKEYDSLAEEMFTLFSPRKK